MEEEKQRGLDRRRFIKGSVRAVGLPGGLSSPLSAVLNRSRATGGTQAEGPAGRAESGWLWRMVIDPKRFFPGSHRPCQGSPVE